MAGQSVVSSADVIDAREALRHHFGHAAFRKGQDDVVAAVLSGHDVLAVMPTGSGKSIGYQLPALLLEGLTLVVSPLIALMKDQVDDLTRRGIPAAALHSNLTSDEWRGVLVAIRSERLRLLYVSPERFGNEGFDRLLGELRVARFAVDEAHCVSEWGHDFRPDYRRLAEAAARCRRADGEPGRPPLIGFTATATPEVRDDIVSLLGMAAPRVFVAGFDRPNLVLGVRKVSGDLEKRRLLPELVAGKRALVYAATRKSAEKTAECLSLSGQRADAYHAGLSDGERTRVQDGFASGEIPIVCATNAFGMGIDRPDVEAVVHYEIPGSLEAYYQEIGRGGRDGRIAVTTLLWNYVDVKTREFFIEKEDDDDDPRRQRAPVNPEQRERKRELDRRKLRRMIDYADTSACLRAALLRYFGETGIAIRCGSCSNCERVKGLDAEEMLTLRKVLSGVARSGERYGKRRIAAMLAGDLEGLPEPLWSLSTTGILADLGAKSLEAWLDAAAGAGYLRATDDVYKTLSLTAEGREVMSGRSTEAALTLNLPGTKRPKEKKVKAPRPASGATGAAAGSPHGSPHAPDADLLERLRDWRRTQAKERKVPPYVVFHDTTLATLAAERPRTVEALRTISGIGPAKLATYGEALLEILR